MRLSYCYGEDIVNTRVVGRIPAFQPSDQGSIPGGIRNFNSYPGTGCVSFVCVLSSVVSGGGLDIVLTTHSGRPALVYLSSVLLQNLLLLLQASDPRAFVLYVPGGGYKSYIGECK